MIPLPLAGVYAIQNLDNGRIYVGASINVDRRIETHKTKMQRGIPENPGILADMQTGPTAFQFMVLQRTFDPNELSDLEQLWADRLGAFEHGYNKRRIGQADHKPRQTKRNSPNRRRDGEP